MSEFLRTLESIGTVVLIVLVLGGAIPVIAGAVQLILASLHGYRNHYGQCRPYLPRTVVVIPAWNEAAVLSASIDRLMTLDYPAASLRIMVVDDASTDDTPEVVEAKARRYPGVVMHVRREVGGEGKAHTLNHGLRIVLADDWAEAILIMDADVIYLPDALRRMTSHLADPRVGSVTAYIQEGSQPGGYLTRFIGFEYVAAQAAARRGQNVLGALACLAGGAQLHSRVSLEAIGGQIDTTTLAEDTVTTFNVQLSGRRAVFEPHAVVLAEEPPRVAALWKQRLRWARGNLQVTRKFAKVWFRPSRRHGLGGFLFGLIWFSLLWQPLYLIVASASLVTLYVTSDALASRAFSILWGANAVTYVFITAVSLLMDPSTARRTWRQAVMFPGAVSLLIIAYQLYPNPYQAAVDVAAVAGLRFTPRHGELLLLLTYLWLAASMGLAWLAVLVERRPGGRWLAPLLVYAAGYGPLLCSITFAAYIKEWRGAEMVWDKTEKTGQVPV